MLPFLEELRYVTTLNYRNNSNVGWVGIHWFGRVMTESEFEEEDEENALYPFMPDSDSEEDTYDTDEHEDCYCHECERPLHTPPFTRLQARNKQRLLDITNKSIESYKQLSYYMYEYMEEQKHYTKAELEQKLYDSYVNKYITEQNYRDIHDAIKKHYDYETKSLKKTYNENGFYQYLMKRNEFDDYINNSIEQYNNIIEKLTYLRKKIDIIKKN